MHRLLGRHLGPRLGHGRVIRLGQGRRMVANQRRQDAAVDAVVVGRAVLWPNVNEERPLVKENRARTRLTRGETEQVVRDRWSTHPRFVWEPSQPQPQSASPRDSPSASPSPRRPSSSANPGASQHQPQRQP